MQPQSKQQPKKLKTLPLYLNNRTRGRRHGKDAGNGKSEVHTDKYNESTFDFILGQDIVEMSRLAGYVSLEQCILSSLIIRMIL